MNPKNVLITGCSSGIGLCLAQGLNARGYRVFATARQPADVANLRALGLESLRLDLADTDSIQAALDAIFALTGGTLFALINNGAYGQPGAVEDLRREVLREQFETNLFGTVDLSNRVIPAMRRQGHGRIVQISSLLGLVALPYRGAYTASKYALEGLSDTLRLELHGSGIAVCLVEPGPVSSHFRANAHAAYRKNIDAENSAHRDIYRAMERRLTKPGPAAPFTLPPEAVLAKVIAALESRKPKSRYYVTFPTYLFAVLRRLLPNPALDWVLRRVSRGENR
ncbi:MAG: SDR family NAD(P)-dependent oxidoreductase [Sulfuricellaceae bacterium]|nr:SDR family NAD(P)-dependent oxidoreductase [Sulfuricellaceae bacterium]